MSTYNEALENIEKTLLKFSDLIKDSYSRNVDLSPAINQFQESIERMVIPFRQSLDSQAQSFCILITNAFKQSSGNSESGKRY